MSNNVKQNYGKELKNIEQVGKNNDFDRSELDPKEVEGSYNIFTWHLLAKD